MTKEKETIKQIHLVCQTGMGDEYEVGVNGVTRIFEDFISDVNGDPMRSSFIVSGEQGIIAEISSNVPFVLKYEKYNTTNND